MKKITILLGAVALAAVLALPSGALAAAKGKILFVPHDNRPISAAETAEVVEQVGYDVLMPPGESLSNGKNRYADTEALWQWTEENIKGAKAAVISSDSLIYGGLVPSRNHEIPEEVLQERTERFAKLRAANQNLKIYVFGSLMRTPRSGAYAGPEEPKYYQQYGAAIFQCSGLLDKQEMQPLTAKEEQQLQALRASIPEDVWSDWFGRRDKNVAVSKKMIDLTRQGTFSYFIIGKDDNAPLSQTHREGRHLTEYAQGLPDTQFQVLAGIDEFGMLLLARAVNDAEMQMPFVYVEYGEGKGADTVPSFSDTRIGNTVRSSVLAAGGVQVQRPDNADLVLLVNTNFDGKTGEANMVSNQLSDNPKAHENARKLVQKANDYIYLQYPVAVADIASANGSDNALMEHLQKGNLLYRLYGYAGWNTATNSTGFTVGMGMLAKHMESASLDRLLTRRYLEDWGYQANIRGQIGQSLGSFRENNVYSNLGDHEADITARMTRYMRAFAEKHLPPFAGLDKLEVTLPWHRMFEADFKW